MYIPDYAWKTAQEILKHYKPSENAVSIREQIALDIDRLVCSSIGVTKRGETFRIKVSLGYDLNGKQIVKSTTFTPPAGATPKKAKKLAAEYAVDFERHCKGYTALNENMRFSEMADWYFENYAPIELQESTAYTYRGKYNKHIAPILGNMKVKDITTPKLTHIMQSYKLNPATVRKIIHCGAEYIP